MARFEKAGILSVALLILTMAAGFLGGVAWQRSQGAADSPPDPEAQRPRDRENRRLVIDEVGLEPAKRAEVEEIIQHFMARMRVLDKEFRQAYRPRQRELYRGVRDSIKGILPPEQRTLYDSLLAVRYGNGHGGEADSSRSKKDKDPRDGHGEQ